MDRVHFAQFFFISALFGFAGLATAQSLQCGDAGCLNFTSTVTVTAYSVHLHSYAQADYVTSDDYDITTNAYLYQDYGVVANQTTTTMGDNTVDLYATPTSGHYYQGGAYGTLTAYYREYVYSNIDFIWEWEYYDPFSYALIAPTPSPSPADPVDYTEPEVPEYIESSVMTMALSWDFGDSTAPPTLSNITVSGSQVPGGSGSISLYGGYLTTRNAGLGTVDIAGGIIVTGYTYDTSSYPWLITITYQIPSGTNPGNYGVTVLTAWGQSNPITLTVTVPPPLQFSVQYASYIPVDHVAAPTPCFLGLYALAKIYMGDGFRNTYRTQESIALVPSGQLASNFFPNTGQTRNYGPPSPAVGSTLTLSDEDGIANDCYLWNAAGTASPAGFQYSIGSPGSNQEAVTFTGSASNPLESASSLGPITWTVTTLVDARNRQAPTATVAALHTCYPAHQVKVNGQIVYSYMPPENDIVYITGCLTGVYSQISAQVGPVTVPPQ